MPLQLDTLFGGKKLLQVNIGRGFGALKGVKGPFSVIQMFLPGFSWGLQITSRGGRIVSG